jgi:carboxymethylenebutenolidase
MTDKPVFNSSTPNAKRQIRKGDFLARNTRQSFVDRLAPARAVREAIRINDLLFNSGLASRNQRLIGARPGMRFADSLQGDATMTLLENLGASDKGMAGSPGRRAWWLGGLAIFLSLVNGVVVLPARQEPSKQDERNSQPFPVRESAAGRASMNEWNDSFLSGGKMIAVERFEPKTTGQHPAVILVHGSNGLTKYGERYREQARRLAGESYVAFLVHFYDRTGHKEALEGDIIKANFLTWLATLDDAVSYAADQKNVDPKRIALLGHSLGAYLSLSLAATNSGSKIAALVEYYGGLPYQMKPIAGRFARIPPILILHGERDRIVPVQEARDLAEFCRTMNIPYEMHLYPNQGHVFYGQDETDSMERTLRFLGKYLREP